MATEAFFCNLLLPELFEKIFSVAGETKPPIYYMGTTLIDTLLPNKVIHQKKTRIKTYIQDDKI